MSKSWNVYFLDINYCNMFTMDKKEIANTHVIIEHQIIRTTFALLQGTKIQNTYNHENVSKGYNTFRYETGEGKG